LTANAIEMRWVCMYCDHYNTSFSPGIFCIVERCHNCNEQSIITIRDCPCQQMVVYCLSKNKAFLLAYQHTTM